MSYSNQQLGTMILDGTTAPGAVSAGSGTASTADNSTATYIRQGHRSRRLTVDTANTLTTYTWTLTSGAARQIVSDDHFSNLVLDIYNATGGTTSTGRELDVRFRNSADTIARTTAAGVASPRALRLGWNRLIVPKSAFASSYGANSWNAATTWLQDIQLRAAAQTGITNDMYLDAVYFNPHTGRVPVVMLDFDDCFASNRDWLFPLMEEYGLPFNLWCAKTFTDTGGNQYMSWDDLAAAKEYFGDQLYVGNHTENHSSAATLEGYSVAQMEDEIGNCEEALRLYGVWQSSTEKHIVTPQGAWSANIVQATQNLGYVTLRGTREGTGLFDLGLQSDKKEDQYDLRIVNMPGTLSTPKTAGWDVAKAVILNTGGHATLLFHATDPNTSGTGAFTGAAASLNVTPGELRPILADMRALVDAGLLRVMARPQFTRECNLVAVNA